MDTPDTDRDTEVVNRYLLRWTTVETLEHEREFTDVELAELVGVPVEQIRATPTRDIPGLASGLDNDLADYDAPDAADLTDFQRDLTGIELVSGVEPDAPPEPVRVEISVTEDDITAVHSVLIPPEAWEATTLVELLRILAARTEPDGPDPR